MKIRPKPVTATCEWCADHNIDCFIITFERAEETYVICNLCIRITQKLLELVGIKESEA